MDTLASRLGAIIEGLTDAPRVYCDANLPAGLIRFMREQLRWDVFFVMEEDDLRRASDIEHFRMAAQLRRTLLTLDKDYLDDVAVPASGRQWRPRAERAAPGAVRAAAERSRSRAVSRVRSDKRPGADASRMPLLGRKLHVHTDWKGEVEPP